MDGICKLDGIAAGNVVRYKSVEWNVVEKDVCKQSEAYVEVQWTLRNSASVEAYLLRTEEKTPGGNKVIWVFTHQTSLQGVTYEIIPGVWRAFEELSIPASPPSSVKFASDYLTFDGETSGLAEDDEGETVAKVTWDYYSTDRRTNLAIEIWKEEDRDYPEAYDGKVVEPSAFEVLDKKVRVSARRAAVGDGELEIKPGEEVKSGLIMVGFSGFFFLIIGVPMDYYLSFGPAACVLVMMVLLRPPLWLWFSSVLIWAAMIALVWFKGFGVSFWYIAAACAALSAVLPRLMASRFPAEDACRYFRTAIFGVFPALWIYSFLEYLMYAPGPRAFYQVAAAILLPLAVTGLCGLISFFTEGTAANG